MVSFRLSAFFVACVSSGQASMEASCSPGSTCGDVVDDEVSAIQVRHASRGSMLPEHHGQHPKSAVCPGSQNGPAYQYVDPSLYGNTKCAGNQCCPGTTATDNKTFPCPTADDFKCEAEAPKEVVYTLVVGTCELNLPGSDKPVMTRCYNGSVPGPTIYVSPGMILTLHLHNTLELPNPPPELINVTDFSNNFTDQSKFGNTTEAAEGLLDDYTTPNSTGTLFGHVNSTNIHVHGIVVPGHQPADDILITVEPGKSYTYTYNIPTYHMPGTHWYHPHRHHAAGIQDNGGLYGAMIVEDTPEVIPPEYLDVEEYLLRINTLSVTLQRMLAVMSEDHLWQTNSTADFTLVNGERNPSFSIVTGRWYRFRMVYNAEFRAIRPVLDDFDGQCQIKLIAKDGIYLNVAPRDVNAMFLSTGNTADVMISCSCSKSTSCSATMRSTWGNVSSEFQSSNLYERTFDGEIFRLDISDDKSACAPDLRKFEVKRPCYLVDLRNATVLEGNNHTVDMIYNFASDVPQFAQDNHDMYNTDPAPGGEFGVSYDGRFERMLHDDQPPIGVIPQEQVQEWAVGGLQYHPMHIHVQPFQLQHWHYIHPVEKVGSEPEAWYEPGDWHDTFFGVADTATTRFAFRLEGISKFVMHCHFLNHEDQGLMTFWNVTNENCTHPSQCAEAIAAETSAKTCFTNYYTLDGPGYKLVQ